MDREFEREMIVSAAKASRFTCHVLLWLALGLGSTISAPAHGACPVVAAGWEYSLVLKGDGTVWAFGWNDHGQLGDGTILDTSIPVDVKDAAGSGILSGVAAVFASGSHPSQSLALL